jgi:replicative DNA helicase
MTTARGGEADAPPVSRGAEKAEEALVGALLWDPGRLADVAWLEPSDFYRWDLRAIYETLLAQHGKRVDLFELTQRLATSDAHEAHYSGAASDRLSPAAVVDLLSMTPASEPGLGSGPSEHRRYAAIILDNSIRRQVHAEGVRIEQKAHEGANQPVEALLENIEPLLAATIERLSALTQRLAESDEQHPAIEAALNPGASCSPARGGTASTATGPTSIEGPATTVSWLGAGPNRRRKPNSAELRHAEYTLIGACLTQPPLRELAQSQLTAEDFSLPEVASTWDAIAALTARRDPIDFVLVGYEVERYPVSQEWPAQLAKLARNSDLVNGRHALATVAHAALLRASEQATLTLRGLGADRSRPAGEVLTEAQQVVRAVEQTQRRLNPSEPAPATLSAAEGAVVNRRPAVPSVNSPGRSR